MAKEKEVLFICLSRSPSLSGLHAITFVLDSWLVLSQKFEQNTQFASRPCHSFGSHLDELATA